MPRELIVRYGSRLDQPNLQDAPRPPVRSPLEISMRFILLDKITSIQSGASIEAVKALSLAEEYLQDHFPRFPVMPGVLMVEAMYQASAWLIRYSEDFAHTGVILQQARNVKFSDFVEPGQLLHVRAQIIKQDDQITTLKTQGSVGDSVAVSARLHLERFNLGERYPLRAARDAFARQSLREQFSKLYQPTTSLETVC